MSIDNRILTKKHTSFKPLYKMFLNEVGIDIEKSNEEIVFTAEYDIIQSLRLLAERIPVNINPWTPYAINNFACYSFTGDFSYLLPRVDHIAGLNGLLLEIQSNCLENSYEQNIKCS